MNRRVLPGLLIFAAMTASACSSLQVHSIPYPRGPEVESSTPISSQSSDNSGGRSFSILSAKTMQTLASGEREQGFTGLLRQDAQYFLTAPVRWERREWTRLGMGIVAVAASAALDEEIRDFIENNSSPASESMAGAFEPFGQEYSWGVLAAFYLGGRHFQNEQASAVARDGLAASVIAAGVITPILKTVVGRKRPSQTEGTFALREGGASFPSGHTTQAFALASVISSHYQSPWVKASAYGIASLVGAARMQNNGHYASDVIAGAVIGTLVGRTVVRLHRGEGSDIRIAPVLSPDGKSGAIALEFDASQLLRRARPGRWRRHGD